MNFVYFQQSERRVSEGKVDRGPGLPGFDVDGFPWGQIFTQINKDDDTTDKVIVRRMNLCWLLLL